MKKMIIALCAAVCVFTSCSQDSQYFEEPTNTTVTTVNTANKAKDVNVCYSDFNDTDMMIEFMEEHPGIRSYSDCGKVTLEAMIMNLNPDYRFFIVKDNDFEHATEINVKENNSIEGDDCALDVYISHGNVNVFYEEMFKEQKYISFVATAGQDLTCYEDAAYMKTCDFSSINMDSFVGKWVDENGTIYEVIKENHWLYAFEESSYDSDFGYSIYDSIWGSTKYWYVDNKYEYQVSFYGTTCAVNYENGTLTFGDLLQGHKIIHTWTKYVEPGVSTGMHQVTL